MTSPDRMRMHEERATRLANLMRDLAQAELEDRERRRAREGWMRTREERAQSMEAHRQDMDRRSIEERMQSMEARRVESDERVRAVIATLTEMQADIARIEASS